MTEENQKIKIDKPKVKLIGENGNAFSIISKVKSALQKGNWEREKIDKVMLEMVCCDYDKLLQTAMKYCNVY